MVLHNAEVLPLANTCCCRRWRCKNAALWWGAPTRLLKEVLDFLLLCLNILLQRVEFLAHDAVLSLQPQRGLLLSLRLRMGAWWELTRALGRIAGLCVLGAATNSQSMPKISVHMRCYCAHGEGRL